MGYQQIAYEVEDQVLTLTLDRPEKLNALTDEMKDELIDALDRADDDDGIRAIVFTGRGRGYCAGADISSGAGAFDAVSRGRPTTIDKYRDGGGQLTLRIFRCKKPVIAAINGPAVGVGITMTLPMDYRLAAEGARMGFVFVRRGIVPEAASTWFLPRVVGINQAADWVYSGRIFDAQEALRAGLVRSVHPPGELLPAARAIAREIIENAAPVSVALSRQMLWRGLVADHPMRMHETDSRAILFLGQTADAAEGVASFVEKRPPRYTMSVKRDLPNIFAWWKEPEFE
jgi:enoyl-CoA hydratase/carnithine racemase